MVKALGAFACVVALAGCAPQQAWFHSTATPEQFNRDKLECEYDARKATVNIRSGIEAGFEQANLQRMCMQVKGYELRRVAQ